MVIILTIVFAYFFLFYFGYKLFMNLRKRQHLPIRDSEQRNSNSSENAVDVASKNEKGANIFVPSKKSSSEDFHSGNDDPAEVLSGTRICAAPNAELDFEGKIDMSPLFLSAVSLVFETGQVTVSMLQRQLKLGYSCAARLVDQMEYLGLVGPFEGSKPRQLLISKEQWQEFIFKRNDEAGKKLLAQQIEKDQQRASLSFELEEYFCGPFNPQYILFLDAVFEAGYYDEGKIKKLLKLDENGFIAFDSLIKRMWIVDKETNLLRVAPSLYWGIRNKFVSIYLQKKEKCIDTFLSLAEDSEEEMLNMFVSAALLAFKKGTLSAPLIQRELSVSYELAKEALFYLEKAGVLTTPSDDEKSLRRVVMSDVMFSVCRAKASEALELRLQETLKELELQQFLFDQNLERKIESLERQAKDAEDIGDLERAENLRAMAEGKKHFYDNLEDSFDDEKCEPRQYISDIDNMTGEEFEKWCGALLTGIGFSNVYMTQSTGDQGVDLLAEKEGVKYAIQCKCYSHDLGNTPIQEVYAGKVFYNCQVAAVVTNRNFTVGAQKAAQATGVLLWDREWLQNKLLETDNFTV